MVVIEGMNLSGHLWIINKIFLNCEISFASNIISYNFLGRGDQDEDADEDVYRHDFFLPAKWPVSSRNPDCATLALFVVVSHLRFEAKKSCILVISVVCSHQKKLFRSHRD